jgi:DNA polymerase phi
MGKKRKRQVQEVSLAAPAAKKQQKETKQSNISSLPSKAPPNPFVEDPKGTELKREVQLYEQLSSQDETERLEAADAVVSGLLGGDGVSEAVLQRHLERRLFRGLASGRKAARLGFSVVVTEILAQLFGKRQLAKVKYSGLAFEKVLGILKAKTKPNGDLSGQEERDHAFGLIFGLQCFVRARVLLEGMMDHWEKVLDDLLRLAKKKSWMREECGWVIVEALGQMNQQQAEFSLQKLQDAGLAASPEGVGMWLIARRKFSKIKFPSKPWGDNGNPLEHLSALAKVLKESSSTGGKENVEVAQQTGNWHPQLHFAWDIVLDECIESTKAGLHDSTSAHFMDFWKVAVDGGCSQT